MRDYKEEFEKRVAFIRELLVATRSKGIVFGNSGGKDCALVGVLCKAACDNTVGIIMPCESRRTFTTDKDDAVSVAEKFGIKTEIIDVTSVKAELVSRVSAVCDVTAAASANIAPRLRMTALYAYAASNGMLVAGTGNACELYMGYFTKWGDGASDFNPIADLYVSEVYEFLEYLGAPEVIIKKAPSAALFEGQTDEDEMGVTYAAIERYIAGESVSPEERRIIERCHGTSRHKFYSPVKYGDEK